MSWKMTVGEGVPEWSGFDSLYNPRHKQRWIFVRLGVGLIVIHFVLVWMFALLTYSYLNAESVDELGWKSFKFAFLPGAASLIYAGWFCRKYRTRPWRLTAAHGVLTYSRPQHWLKTKMAEWCNDSVLFTILLTLTVGVIAEILNLDLEDNGPERVWTARLADVARVETDATARWEPARPGVIGDNPVSGDEVQAFLFMQDGSRRVIASVHAGREDLARLTHSIRSWVDQQRQPERLMRDHRLPIAAPVTPDGFNI